MNTAKLTAKIDSARRMLALIPGDTQDQALLAEKSRLTMAIDRWQNQIGPAADDDAIKAMMAEFGIAVPKRNATAIKPVERDRKSGEALLGVLTADGKTARPIEDQIKLLAMAIGSVDATTFDTQADYDSAVAGLVERFVQSLPDRIGVYRQIEDGTADASPRIAFVALYK